MRAWAGVLLMLATFACVAPAQAREHAPVVHHRHAVRHRTRAFQYSTEMRDDGRSSSKSYAARAPGGQRLRPSIDTRVNELGDGAVASFGYHPGVVAPTLGPHELNGAAEPRLGHAESSAGVSVKVPL